MERLEITDITVADFAAGDIPGMLDYWYRSPPEYLLGMGVSPDGLPREKLMREMLEINVEKNRSSPDFRQAILSIRLRGETIGVHELTHIVPAVSGVMHAHIWQGSHRRLGIGVVSYVKAMNVFFERFGLEEIVFETPAANAAAQKIKSKLGIAPSGTGSIVWPILKGTIETVTYRVPRAQMPAIEASMRAEWQCRQARRQPGGPG